MESEDIEKATLLKTKNTKAQGLSFKLLFQYATLTDLLIFSIGVTASIIIGIGPSIQIMQTGEILKIIEENFDDEDEFYESERNLAVTNYCIGIIALLVGIIGITCFVRFRTHQGLFWKQAYFRAMTSQPIKWFDKRNPSELGNSISTECNAIEIGLGEKLMMILSGISFFLLSWAICFYLSLEISLVLLIKLPLSFGSYYAAMKTSEKVMLEKQVLYQKAGGIVEESLEGIKTVASCNAQHLIAKRYQAELEPLKNSGTLLGTINGIAWGIFFFQFLFFTGLGFYIGMLLIDKDVDTWTGTDLGVKEVFVTSMISAIASLGLSLTIPSLSYIYSSRVAAGSINKIIQKTKQIDGMIKPQSIQGTISFEKVYFNYPTKPEVNILQGVSFSVEAGDSLAIVGETGSGKSTIVQLIEGFYYCSSGAVKIDGIDMREYDLSALRNFISLISQEPILFNCTIEENIKIGKEDASPEEIRGAATEAEARLFIENLPDKFKTWVGVKGALLSGGQKQRIALARGIIKKPRILLLDEATSALDVNTESAIQSTIDKIMIGSTTVIVAQRLSTIKRAKQIVVLDKGCVVEVGDYESLIAKDGHFKGLLGVQKEVEKKVALQIADIEAHDQNLKKIDETEKAEETTQNKYFLSPGYLY